MTDNITDYLGESWGKYFLKEGKEVIHVSEIKKEDPIIIIVDKVLRVRVQTKPDPDNKDEPNRIVGVKCHWFKDGDYRTGIFHTKELVPLDVFLQGSYEDWIKR